MANIDPYSQQVARELEASAREQGLSQNELARRSGVSQAQISRIFKFLRAVSVEDLDLIAQALGVRGSVILKRAERVLTEER